MVEYILRIAEFPLSQMRMFCAGSIAMLVGVCRFDPKAGPLSPPYPGCCPVPAMVVIVPCRIDHAHHVVVGVRDYMFPFASNAGA